LHEYIEELPPAERSVVDLLFYAGLTQDEAADTLSIPLTTLQGRWRSAKAKLALSAADRSLGV
jgi:RNA polymerase sigma-70 factor (ECF subfamily)